MNIKIYLEVSGLNRDVEIIFYKRTKILSLTTNLITK